MKRLETDPGAGEPSGGLTWYRVALQEDLRPGHSVSGVVYVPHTATSTTESDFWRSTERIVHKIHHGLPSEDIIPQGAHCWIHFYFGRWVVVIPECS